jgi:hypothetical protein
MESSTEQVIPANLAFLLDINFPSHAPPVQTRYIASLHADQLINSIRYGA